MNIAGQLILVHLVIGSLFAFCLATIRGCMADFTYEARMGTFLRRFLMPGKLANREVWVRQQKVLAWAGLAFGAIVYVLVMIRILS